MWLLTWNVYGRVRLRPEQAAAVLAAAADVIALQEVTPTTVAGWTEDLRGAGYNVLTTAAGQRPADRRRLGLILASRSPLSAAPPVDVPWPERALAARTAGLRVYNVHSPVSESPGRVKVRTHEALHEHLARGRGPRVLCGDLNTPRRETPEGEVMTFARTSSGKLRPERGARHDRAELALIRGLEPHGWRDAFRLLHGYEARDRSWVWPNGGGYRLDHVIVSRGIEVRRCEYLHAWREHGLSDHSALLAELAIPDR
jgi:endonuclease/exonuclease/phosphatase family metal-dependent hydrolase